MEKINIIVIVFLVELICDFIVLKIFKIKYKVIYILFLQIPKVLASVSCLFMKFNFCVEILIKIFAKLITVIFLTDSFKFKKLIKFLFLEYVLLFSVGGFALFLIKWLESIYSIKLMKNFPNNRRYLLIIGIICYIFAVFKLTRIISKNTNFNRNLVEVSLMIGSKHINVYGLVDSGNSLIDIKTNKPVLVISLQTITKLISKNDYKKMIDENSHKLDCETISSSSFSIPILENINVKVKIENEWIVANCVVGVVDKKFENGKYDCLLWRDFI